MSRSIHFADKGVRARTAASEAEVLARLREIVGAENVLVDEERVEPYAGDALKEKFPPEAVVLPQSAVEVSEILKLANERGFPVTARGGGVGYTGGAVPVEGGIVIGTDRMNRIREVSVENLYAVTEPGVTKHYVLGLEVVLPTGEIVRTGGLTSKNVVGFDLTGLVCGSEGMLGIITEATLKLLQLPETTSTVRETFKTMNA